MENLLQSTPKSTGQVLENIGYSKGVTETPNMVLGTEGFKQALAETGLKKALEKAGINPDKIAEKINILLNAADKEGNSDFTAIDKGLKHATAIYGITEEPVKNPSNNTYNFLFSAETQADVKAIEDKIKARLIQKNVQTNQEPVESK